MQGFVTVLRGVVLACVLALTGCAGSALLTQPTVQLQTVELAEATLAGQSVLLGFDVHNPNPYPLPVQGVRYKVRFNDQNFAGGETDGGFTIPADGQGSFVISMDMDLLGSGTQLASLLRAGLSENVHYELYGNLDLALPTSPSVAFTQRGSIPLNSRVAKRP
ncbi:MAG: LEA type 2 family protein [Pseudomonadota bacterium]